MAPDCLVSGMVPEPYGFKGILWNPFSLPPCKHHSYTSNNIILHWLFIVQCSSLYTDLGAVFASLSYLLLLISSIQLVSTWEAWSWWARSGLVEAGADAKTTNMWAMWEDRTVISVTP